MTQYVKRFRERRTLGPRCLEPVACPRPGALPAGLSLPRTQKQDRVSACLLKDSLSSRPSGCSRTGRARRVSPKAVGAERTCSCGCGRRSGCSGRGTSSSAWGHVIGQAHHWVSVAVEWCGEVPGGCRVTEGDPVCAHAWVSLSRRAQARSSLGVGPSAGQMCVEDMRGAWAPGPRVPWEQPRPLCAAAVSAEGLSPRSPATVGRSGGLGLVLRLARTAPRLRCSLVGVDVRARVGNQRPLSHRVVCLVHMHMPTPSGFSRRCALHDVCCGPL